MALVGATLLAVTVTAAPADADPGTGIRGHLTADDGQPAVNWHVDVETVDGQVGGDAITGADGSYLVDDLAPGSYQIFFYNDDFSHSQWAHQKYSRDDADVFTVGEGTLTTVDETLFGAGSISATAIDKVTGRPLTGFCVDVSGYAGGRNGCTDNGTVTLADLTVGDYHVSGTADGHFGADTDTAVVVAHQTIQVQLVFEPDAGITTTALDAVTGAPVAGACASAAGRYGGLPDHFLDCSGPDGKIILRGLRTGTYRLFVNANDGVHGAQWVGATGGTGDKAAAAQVHAIAGRTVTGPTIRLDGSGTIAGKVTDKATTAAVPGICAFVHGAALDTTTSGPFCTNSQGKYKITGVGPYAWPVQFADATGAHAWQWSGNRTTRHNAVPVQVTAGATTTANASLDSAAHVTGRVANTSGDPAFSAVFAYNASDGEPVAPYALTDDAGNYTLAVAGPQNIRLYADTFGSGSVWYPNATTFANSTPIAVAKSATVTGIDFTLP